MTILSNSLFILNFSIVAILYNLPTISSYIDKREEDNKKKFIFDIADSLINNEYYSIKNINMSKDMSIDKLKNNYKKLIISRHRNEKNLTPKLLMQIYNNRYDYLKCVIYDDNDEKSTFDVYPKNINNEFLRIDIDIKRSPLDSFN